MNCPKNLPGFAFSLALALSCGGAVLAQQPPAKPSLAGIWSGALTVNGGIKLRLVLNVAGEPGAYSATLDSLDQGAKGIPVDAVAETDGAVTFSIKAIGGSYQGTLDAARSKITGTWGQGGLSLPLVLERVAAAPTLARPQEPRRPFPYAEEDVSFENKAAGITLAGTLTKPREGGPFPVVVLLTGSGAQDRDESLLGHKPFLVLSDYLTRRGMAVLRFDDRGTGRSTGKYSLSLTIEDFMGDGRAAVAFLKTRADLDPKRIGVVGHSEGALVAPALAAEDPSIAFVVMMAGPGVRGDLLLAEQNALVSRALGVESDLDDVRTTVSKAYQIIVSEPDNASAEKKLRALREEELAKLPEAERQKEVAKQGEWEQGLKLLLSPYIRTFLKYDPRPALTKVACPVLAVNGELDLQVPARQNLPAIAAALEEGGNGDYAVVKLRGLNHLFQPAKTGAPSEYGEIEETFSPVALRAIGDWLAERARVP